MAVSLNCRAQLLRITMRLSIVTAGKICSGDVSVTAPQYAICARKKCEAGGSAHGAGANMCVGGERLVVTRARHLDGRGPRRVLRERDR